MTGKNQREMQDDQDNRSKYATEQMDDKNEQGGH